jgi:serine/threonine-protein kinase ATR
MTIERMFSPFWDTLAIVAVEQLLVRPQASQLMADLLGKTVQDFIVLTQSSTLPILVASGKVDIIKRIERAQIQVRKDKKAAEKKEKEKKEGVDYENANDDIDPGPICNQTTNLTHILAVLLVQNVPNTEEYILSSLKATSSQLQDIDMNSIMKTAPATVALHLLKDIGDADDSKKSRVCIVHRVLRI